MKLTEQEIADFARQEANRSKFSSIHPFDLASVEHGAKKGANWAISQMQPEWVALEQENEKLRKTIELAISGLEMYNNTGGLYVDIKLALRASIGMELITVNGNIDARQQPPTK